MTDRRQRASIEHPLQVIGLFVLAAAVAVGGYLMLVAKDRPVAVPKTLQFRLSTAPSQPGGLFIGDSYAAGDGQVGGTGGGFACLTAVLLRWSCIPDAESGTGYVATGHAVSGTNGAYGSRLATDVAKYIPDYVVVTGGGDDPAGELTDAAAKQYVHALADAFPKAKLIVVAPFWTDASPPPRLLALRDALSSAASEVGATFIDPLADAWALPAEDLASDGKHPNAAGHVYLAQHLADAIKAALPSPSPSPSGS